MLCINVPVEFRSHPFVTLLARFFKDPRTMKVGPDWSGATLKRYVNAEDVDGFGDCNSSSLRLTSYISFSFSVLVNLCSQRSLIIYQ